MATVEQIIAAQEVKIATVLADAVSYLDKLREVAAATLISGETVLPEQYDYNSVPFVSFPIFGAPRPLLTGLTFPAPPEAPTISFSSVALVPFPTDDLLAPTAVFAFAEQPYVSALLDAQKAKLLDNLQNGGYGIETADEIALFDRARDREVEAMLSRIDDAGRALASRGFPLPPGELQIQVDRGYQEMQSKVSSASRDITLRRSELFVDNRKFTITEVRGLETVLMNYWNSMQERALNAARATLELSILTFNYLLARYSARWAAAKITADVNLANAQIEVSRAQAHFEIFRSQIMGYEARIRSVIEPARLQVELYAQDVNVARVVNDGAVSLNSLQQEVIKSTVQQNLQVDHNTIENARVRLLGITESLRFKTGAAHSAADKFFAQLTALEGTINTLAVQNKTE